MLTNFAPSAFDSILFNEPARASACGDSDHNRSCGSNSYRALPSKEAILVSVVTRCIAKVSSLALTSRSTPPVSSLPLTRGWRLCRRAGAPKVRFKEAGNGDAASLYISHAAAPLLSAAAGSIFKSVDFDPSELLSSIALRMQVDELFSSVAADTAALAQAGDGGGGGGIIKSCEYMSSSDKIFCSIMRHTAFMAMHSTRSSSHVAASTFRPSHGVTRRAPRTSLVAGMMSSSARTLENRRSEVADRNAVSMTRAVAQAELCKRLGSTPVSRPMPSFPSFFLA
mmetsp:Transcript_1977/g.5225  ORF Transcript_1977/g.5225 Transcript_1977/m.5225 type:complete len:283 (-) Transcript_1977:2014-2862(-)